MKERQEQQLWGSQTAGVVTGRGRVGQSVWEDVFPVAHCQPLLDLLIFFLTLGWVSSPNTGSNDLRGR